MTAAPTGVPVSPSIRIQMALIMASSEFRCGGASVYGGGVHMDAMRNRSACPVCQLTLGDYARALDVVVWP